MSYYIKGDIFIIPLSAPALAIATDFRSTEEEIDQLAQGPINRNLL